MFAFDLDIAGISARAALAAAAGGDDDKATVRERPLVAQEEKAKPQQPPLYAVILLNDDYTPRDFVTRILKKHFGLDGDSAETIMMHAHRYGEARVGAWQKDIAETRMHNAEEEAHEEGHPLQFRCHPLDT
jgi:ATP-dependent Clp protease adaptor protein ClpS